MYYTLHTLTARGAFIEPKTIKTGKKKARTKSHFVHTNIEIILTKRFDFVKINGIDLPEYVKYSELFVGLFVVFLEGSNAWRPMMFGPSLL